MILKIKTKLLKETINELKTNPKAITLYQSKYEEKNTKNVSFITPKIITFFEYLKTNNLLDDNYKENHKKIEEKPIKKMKYKEIMTELTYIYEEDKTTGGAIYKSFEEGHLLELLERLYRLKILFLIPFIN